MAEPITREWLKSIGIYPSEAGKKNEQDEPTEFGCRIVGGSDDGWKEGSDDDKEGDEVADLVVILEPGEPGVSVYVETWSVSSLNTVSLVELGKRSTREEVLDLCRSLKAWAIKQPEPNALGHALAELVTDQSVWSQATFGTDYDRGPIGALKHLGKEAGEAVEAAEAVQIIQRRGATPEATRDQLAEELADCLLLVLDASRRAGLNPLQLIQAAQAKMVVNKSRTWPKTTGDVPSEHQREAEAA